MLQAERTQFCLTAKMKYQKSECDELWIDKEMMI